MEIRTKHVGKTHLLANLVKECWRLVVNKRVGDYKAKQTKERHGLLLQVVMFCQLIHVRRLAGTSKCAVQLRSASAVPGGGKCNWTQ